MPSPNEPRLVNAGEEASKILIVKLKDAMFRSLAKDRKYVVNITSGEVIWAGIGNGLKDHSSKNVQHRTERSVHEGNDWTTTGEVLFLLGQDIAGRELTSLSSGPWIGRAVLAKKLIDQS